MTIAAGPPDTTFSRPLQIGSMAERTGGGKVAGRFVTVERSAAPRGQGMGAILSVTVLTALFQRSQRHIKARIAAGPTVGGLGMTFLTVSQVGFCFRPVQVGFGKRKRMGGAGSTGMATGCRAVGIREFVSKAARGGRIGRLPAFGKIVTDVTGCVLGQRISVGRKVVDRIIVGSLPFGRMRGGCRMTLGRRTAGGGRAAFKFDGARNAVALLAVGEIVLGLRTMQDCIGKRNGVRRSRTI